MSAAERFRQGIEKRKRFAAVRRMVAANPEITTREISQKLDLDWRDVFADRKRALPLRGRRPSTAGRGQQ